ncbi:hypothetical protein OS493_019402 [Desmophyllum pertusum]|uniref:Uncharacterized protein n=1 Tax=Desmophyllum pertusum TaxID=174260 RepID=A0A9X0A1G7_9CNID|nr:hypothetical protein OS493_019402 [Desmophyllum pertusum]
MKPSINSELVISLAKHLSGERSFPTPLDVGNAFVLGVSKKETLVKQELLAINRFLCCRGLAIIGRDKVNVFRRAMVDGSTFSCARIVQTLCLVRKNAILSRRRVLLYGLGLK